MKHFALAFLAAALVAVAPAHAQKTASDVVDDNTINASVKAELAAAKDLEDSQIVVETYKGIVLLAGFLPSQAQEDQAGKGAKGVSNVKTVHNAISVHAENTARGDRGRAPARAQRGDLFGDLLGRHVRGSAQGCRDRSAGLGDPRDAARHG